VHLKQLETSANMTIYHYKLLTVVFNVSCLFAYMQHSNFYLIIRCMYHFHPLCLQPTSFGYDFPSK